MISSRSRSSQEVDPREVDIDITDVGVIRLGQLISSVVSTVCGESGRCKGSGCVQTI